MMGKNIRLLSVCLVLLCSVARGESFIVKAGNPNAEIVISGKPPRMTRLAASELQKYIAKISGARLPIVTEPTSSLPVRIFVGRSVYTDKLGIGDDGLDYGAYRMVSGSNYLILLGRDSDFTPPEPYAKSHSDIPRAREEWDRLTGEKWLFPHALVYKHYNRAEPLGLRRTRLLQRGLRFPPQPRRALVYAGRIGGDSAEDEGHTPAAGKQDRSSRFRHARARSLFPRLLRETPRPDFLAPAARD